MRKFETHFSEAWKLRTWIQVHVCFCATVCVCVCARAFENMCFCQTAVRRVNHFPQQCRGSSERQGGKKKRELQQNRGLGYPAGSEHARIKSWWPINKQQICMKIPFEMTWKISGALVINKPEPKSVCSTTSTDFWINHVQYSQQNSTFTRVYLELLFDRMCPHLRMCSVSSTVLGREATGHLLSKQQMHSPVQQGKKRELEKRSLCR